MFHIPAGETFLLLEELEERIGIVAIHLHFLEAGEFSAEIELAEFMDTLVGARSLLTELIAWEVENFKPLGMILLVEGLEFVILWRKATLSSRILF